MLFFYFISILFFLIITHECQTYLVTPLALQSEEGETHAHTHTHSVCGKNRKGSRPP